MWGRLRKGVLVLAGLAALCSGLAVPPIFAATLSLPASPAAKPQVEHFLFYGGYDGWYAGSFASGGMLWSPGGLERDGFITRFMAGAGTYKYRAGTTDTVGYVAILESSAAPRRSQQQFARHKCRIAHRRRRLG